MTVNDTDIQTSLVSRRRVLKMLGYAGLAASLPAAPLVRAQSSAPPLLLHLALAGGLDQSSWCDPRNSTTINHYPDGARAARAGNIWHAPFTSNLATIGRHYDKMLVFNGVNLRNGGHVGAGVYQASGRLAPGYPSITALHAAIHGQGMPIPWLVSTDRQVIPAGVQAPTRIDAPSMRTLARPNAPDSDATFTRPAVHQAVSRHRLARLQRQQQAFAEKRRMPLARRNLEHMLDARAGGGSLDRLAELLPDVIDNTVHQMMLSFAAGTSVAATLSIGGFDTHNSHDDRQIRNQTNLCSLIDEAWRRADELGLSDRLVVYISSDVGRRPFYNSSNGKDHLAWSSCTIMAHGRSWTNRVVGVSGADDHKAVAINGQSLQPDSDGVVVFPEHVHQTLRSILGIDQHPLCRQDFPLPPQDLAVFGSATSPVPVG